MFSAMTPATFCFLAFVRGVASHGWLMNPVPRNVLVCDSRGESDWGCKADRETHPPHAGDMPGPPGGNVCSGDNNNGISGEARQQMMQPGPIQARYTSGQVADMSWTIYGAANHGGWFEYRICLDGSDTENCFRSNVLVDTAGRTTHGMTTFGTGEWKQYHTQVQIPADMECDRCTLSWFWHGQPCTGRNYFDCENNIFINCADISISRNGSSPSPQPTPSPVPTPSTPAPTPPTSGGCCRFGASCGDCGDDGTGWCHQSAGNCAVCTGSFDSSASTPSCGGGGSPSPSPSPSPNPVPTPSTPAPTPPSTGGQCCYGGGCSNCNGAGEWCSSSRSACEGSCGGSYCSGRSSLAVVSSLRKVMKHE